MTALEGRHGGDVGGGVLPEWLGRRAALTPDKTALEAGGRSWTFQELDGEATALARAVAARLAESSAPAPAVGREHGVEAPSPAPPVGPRVGVLMGNHAGFVQTVHGLPKAGAVLVPLNTRLATRELAWQLADAEASLLLCDEAHRDTAAAIARDVPGLAWASVEDVRRTARKDDAAVPLRTTVRLDDVHSIVYTSGTTGKPKGALLTYGNFWWSVTGSALHLGVTSEDKWLACMPLFHVGGLSILLRGVISGMAVLLHETFDEVAVHKAIDEEGVTLLSVVAVMLERMLTARGDAPYPERMRGVLVGGGPVAPALLRRALAAGLPVLQTYGLTEAASQVATLSPEDALCKLGSAGKPLFPTRLRILAVLDEDADAKAPRGAEPGETGDGGRGAEEMQSLPPGEVGEIAVSGPTVSPGYWTATRKAKAGRIAPGPRDGWFRTGDLGRFDEEGYLYVVDRRDDLFVSGGENVYPAEVEAVLTAHPDVAEAAVVGVPDARWGKVPMAVVVPRGEEGTDEVALQAHCRSQLAAYKVPTRIVAARELPRNAAGKLLRRRVRHMLEHLFQDAGATDVSGGNR